MYSKKVIVKNPTGLHARPGSMFAMKALEFQSTIKISKTSDPSLELNAKSLMKLLALGVTQGEEVEIKAEGTDEKEAVDTLVEFIDNGCGE